MKHVVWAIQGLALLLAGAASAQGAKPLSKCAPDAVPSGSVCVDRYEASVWRVSDPGGFNAPLADKIRKGQVTLDDLLAGARQLGTVDDYAPCTDGGQNCIGFTDPPQLLDRNIFAVSLPGVVPAAHISWFQAQQACKNSRKRLPTSAEWQAAAAGTPDPGDDDASRTCNTSSAQGRVPTGSREDCVSAVGAFDMVGNLSEWVADAVPLSASAPCGSWSTGDLLCLNGARVDTASPGLLQRGGNATSGSAAGPLALVDAEPGVPTTSTTTTTTTTTDTSSTTTSSTTTTTLPPLTHVGFRCVR